MNSFSSTTPSSTLQLLPSDQVSQITRFKENIWVVLRLLSQPVPNDFKWDSTEVTRIEKIISMVASQFNEIIVASLLNNQSHIETKISIKLLTVLDLSLSNSVLKLMDSKGYRPKDPTILDFVNDQSWCLIDFAQKLKETFVFLK